jgi:hypothetical protein
MIEFSLSNKELIPFSKRFAYFLANWVRSALKATDDSKLDVLPKTKYDDLIHSVIFFGEKCAADEKCDEKGKEKEDIKENEAYTEALFEAKIAAEKMLFGEFNFAGKITSTSELGLLDALDEISNQKPLGEGAFSIGIELKGDTGEPATHDVIVKPKKFTYSAYVEGGDLNGLLTNLMAGNVQKLERKIDVLVSSVKIVDGDKTYPPMFSNYRDNDRFLLSCLALAIKENFSGIKKSSNLHLFIKR